MGEKFILAAKVGTSIAPQHAIGHFDDARFLQTGGRVGAWKGAGLRRLAPRAAIIVGKEKRGNAPPVECLWFVGIVKFPVQRDWNK